MEIEEILMKLIQLVNESKIIDPEVKIKLTLTEYSNDFDILVIGLPENRAGSYSKIVKNITLRLFGKSWSNGLIPARISIIYKDNIISEKILKSKLETNTIVYEI